MSMRHFSRRWRWGWGNDVVVTSITVNVAQIGEDLGAHSTAEVHVHIQLVHGQRCLLTVLVVAVYGVSALGGHNARAREGIVVFHLT